MAYRTARLRLIATAKQEKMLADTQELARLCFNAIAEYGWKHDVRSRAALYRAMYHDMRHAYPILPSPLVSAVLSKAAAALSSVAALKKKGRKVSQPHSEQGSVRYNVSSFRLHLREGIAGLSTAGDRIHCRYIVHEKAKILLDQSKSFDIADLVHCPSGWWLHVMVKIDLPQVKSVDTVIGVDLGINRPAVTSEADFLGERRWKEVDQRYFRLVRSLQEVGTKSAKRHLKKIAHRRKLFRRDCDHVLSKRIVQSVEPGSVIVVEDLTNIRYLKVRGAKNKRRHNDWSYAQQRTFLTYKAEDKGCQVVAVDPRNTSNRCNRCGYTDKANRVTQGLFRCRCCGYEINADLGAARNIRDKHAQTGRAALCGAQVSRPIVGDSLSAPPASRSPAAADT